MRRSSGALALVALIALLSCSSVAKPRPQIDYPTKEEVIVALKDVDYEFRRFEEVTDRVNLSRWKVSDGLRQVIEKDLTSLREKLTATKPVITRIEHGERISAVDLFWVLDALEDMAETAYKLGSSDAPSKDLDLASELVQLSTRENRAVGSFRKLFLRNLEAQEKEVNACRQRTK